MNTATLVKTLKGWNGDARLFKLDPPMNWDEGKTDHVIVSAVSAMFSGPETYIFPANAAGEPLDYAELNGSQRGILDHSKALSDAGYEVVS